MAANEFFFAIDVSGASSSDLVRKVASQLLVRAGLDAARAPKMIDAVEAAIAKHATAPGAPCRVTFVASDGHLDISVSSAAGQLWQTRQSLA